ncbi:MAG: InlB B-repeat-containing protein, partial [Candidatus Izemoplasmatales bacterium]
MKKFIIGLFLLFGLIIGLSTTDFADVEAAKGDFNFTYDINYDGGTPGQNSILASYGQKISIDSGSLGQSGYEFLGWIVKDKVMQGVQASIRVTENTTASAFFKPENSTAVIFMDTNQDFIDVIYTTATDLVDSEDLTDSSLDHLNYSKPGLTATGWTSNGTDTIDFSTKIFTEDTIVFPIYENSGTEQYTLTVENGTGQGDFAFNDIATVSANGEGTFNYWLKDGEIASTDETFSFTMTGDHTLEAVYDSGFTADSDTFITADLFEMDGKANLLGQFVLPEGEELVEWGILLSDMPGGITHKTPDVQIVNSNKYNPNTNEFVLMFNDTVEDFQNYRAFVTTADEFDNITTTYSYVHKDGYADELFISEYLDWDGGTNKAIELYNGTNQTIDLSEYSIKTAANGKDTWTNTTPNPLEGILQPGETFVLVNSSVSVTELENKANDFTTANFNGNDAIGLFKNDTLIDIFGVLGEDPGSAWTIEGGNTVDATVIRKASVLGPFVDESGINPQWDDSQWISMDDSTTNLGSHSINLPLMPVMGSELPASLSISGSSTVNVGETIQLNESYPSGGLEGHIWFSSDDSIATIDQNGLVTGVAEGNVMILLYSYFDHDIIASHTVDVLPVQTYDVTFNYNDGSTSPTVETVEGGEAVTEPTDPTRSGFEFDGWFTDDTTFTNSYNFSNAVSEDVQLYAKWIEEFTVSFDLNEGTADPAILPQTVLDGNLATEPNTPTRDGFVFDGWFTDDETFENDFDFATDTITADITLYAKWVDDNTPIPVEEYYADFDQGGKTSYAGGEVTVNGLTWDLNEALLGSLSNDKFNGSYSIRARDDAYAELQHDFSNLYSIKFSYAYYGSETSANLSVSISND